MVVGLMGGAGVGMWEVGGVVVGGGKLFGGGEVEEKGMDGGGGE